MNKKLTCLVCPRGCTLTIDEPLNVSGNFCPRGIPYALQELKAPKRTLTYLVKVKGHSQPLPVRSDAPIDKALIFEAVAILNTLELTPPIDFNTIVVENILGSGVNIIATRKFESNEDSYLRKHV